jgi:hypothetical protein
MTFPSSTELRTLWNINGFWIKLKPMQQLLEISKRGYDSCFQEWQNCWNKCVLAEKAYFKEG